MRGGPRTFLALAGLLVAGCGGEPAPPVDTSMPGSILRFGPPSSPDARPKLPIVDGDSGQISIHQGYFVRAACAGGLKITPSVSGDTIVARVSAPPDTTKPCAEDATPELFGYAALVGQFEPGDYYVRVIHEGEPIRAEPADSLYRATVLPPHTVIRTPETGS